MKMVKILIVDDEESVCEALGWGLKTEGYDVTYLTDFQEAMKTIQELGFDIYIIDIFFPGYNGFDLLRQIRKLGKEGITIIMTGYPDVSTLIDSIRLCAFDYIRKPFAQDRLIKVIEHFLKVKNQLTESDYRNAPIKIQD